MMSEVEAEKESQAPLPAVGEQAPAAEAPLSATVANLIVPKFTIYYKNNTVALIRALVSCRPCDPFMKTSLMASLNFAPPFPGPG